MLHLCQGLSKQRKTINYANEFQMSLIYDASEDIISAFSYIKEQFLYISNNVFS